MSIHCIIDLQNLIRLFQFLRHELTMTKQSGMQVLCDDVNRVCSSCCNLRRAQFGVSREMHRLSRKISIQPALEHTAFYRTK